MTMRLVDVAADDPRLVREVLPVLVELRPHLTAAALRAVAAHAEGARFLAAYDEGGACVGVAGWRLLANTAAGRELVIDDLVTTESKRSSGVGQALLAELEKRARDTGCAFLSLDSAVHRARAHRFYFRERMDIVAFHFGKRL